MNLANIVCVYSLNCRKEGREDGEEKGCRVGSSSKDSSTMRNRWWCSFSYSICVRVHVWVCFLKTLLLTHLDDRSCSPLYFGSSDTILKGFPPYTHRLVFQSHPSVLPSSVHPAFSSLARPCSGLHRGECVWDGVAVGPTGKQRFSPASKTSSWLSRVVPNVMKQHLGRLFSLPPTG